MMERVMVMSRRDGRNRRGDKDRYYTRLARFNQRQNWQVGDWNADAG